jgi:hypothetical protein
MPKSVEERLAATPPAVREVVVARIEAILGTAERSAERLGDQEAFVASLDAAVEEGQREGFVTAAELDADAKAVIANPRGAASARFVQVRGMANATDGGTTDEIMEALRGPWDDVLHGPGADFGERGQPAPQSREAQGVPQSAEAAAAIGRAFAVEEGQGIGWPRSFDFLLFVGRLPAGFRGWPQHFQDACAAGYEEIARVMRSVSLARRRRQVERDRRAAVAAIREQLERGDERVGEPASEWESPPEWPITWEAGWEPPGADAGSYEWMVLFDLHSALAEGWHPSDVKAWAVCPHGPQQGPHIWVEGRPGTETLVCRFDRRPAAEVESPPANVIERMTRRATR